MDRIDSLIAQSFVPHLTVNDPAGGRWALDVNYSSPEGIADVLRLAIVGRAGVDGRAWHSRQDDAGLNARR